MKNLFSLILFFVLGFGVAGQAFACISDDSKDSKKLTQRFAFNIGEEAYAINMPPGNKATFAMDSGTMSDLKQYVTITFLAEWKFSLSIPSKRIYWTGTYGPADRCFNPPNVVFGWDDDSQQAAFEKVRDEIGFLAYHPNYRYWESGDGQFRLYVSQKAWELLHEWQFSLDIEDDFKLKTIPGRRIPLRGSMNAPNEVVFIDLSSDPENPVINLSGREVSSKRMFYTLARDGKLTNKLN